MDVAITYLNSEDQALEVVDLIRSTGRRAHAIQVDMSLADAAEVIVDGFRARFDRLDVLVNNASVFESSPLGAVSAPVFNRDMAVNALVPLLLIQSFAESLGSRYRDREPATSGRVVNFIDTHVMGEPLPKFVSYSASKAALMEITSTCAVELAPRVTVNAVAPGVVAWAGHYSQPMREEYLRRVPLAVPGTPEDAAQAVLFLARDAHYCTGQVIRIDGGRLLT